jgi:cbb3-type cytochrome oxidase maturation protein
VESFYLLIPIALIFVALALRLLFWAINSGQYDNLDTEAHRILFDEDVQPHRPSASDTGNSGNAETKNIPTEADPIKQRRAETSGELPNE